MSDIEYKHLLVKAREAKRGGIEAWSVQSTGEGGSGFSAKPGRLARKHGLHAG